MSTPSFSPAPFRLYPQTLEARFGSVADARDATLAFRALPPGAELALSSRWDDSNPRHLDNARAVTAAGAKATYYLNGVDEAFAETVVRPVQRLGCSVGAHTATHPYLPTLQANGIFDEILGNRIDVECAADACVTAFTLPFCDYDLRANPGARTAIGESLRRAGLLGGGDVLENPAAAYGLPADALVGCLHYGFDDRHPSTALFEQAMGKAEERFRTGDLPACGAHVAMGTHSWADDEGMAEITRAFETRTRNPAAPFAGRTWCCNENEFIAAWMQARHARVADVARDGATVRWTLLRPEPADVGADVPLCVQFGRLPVAILLDGKAAGVTEAGQAALANASGHRTPSRIERLSASDGAAGPAVSSKFPGVGAGLVVDLGAGRARLVLRNGGTAALRRLRATLRVPPAFAADPAPETAVPESLAAGAEAVVEYRLERIHADAWHCDGPSLFDAEVDFDLDGAAESGRLHVTWRRVAPRTPVPGSLRDAAMVSVALPAVLWTPTKLCGISRPGVPLDELRLFPMDDSPVFSAPAFHYRSADPEAQAIADGVPAEARAGRLHLLVAEFEATGREATLESRGHGTLYLNGEEREFRKGARLPTRAGRNRAVLVQPMSGWCFRGAMAVFEDGASAPCRWTRA